MLLVVRRFPIQPQSGCQRDFCLLQFALPTRQSDLKSYSLDAELNGLAQCCAALLVVSCYLLCHCVCLGQVFCVYATAFVCLALSLECNDVVKRKYTYFVNSFLSTSFVEYKKSNQVFPRMLITCYVE